MNGKIEDDKILSDKEFNSFLDDINELEHKRVDERSIFMTELDGTLDNNQRYKLAMFKHKFANDMQMRLKKKRNRFNEENK